MVCILCQRVYEPSLNLTELISFRPIFKEIICSECWQQFELIGEDETVCCQRCLKKMGDHSQKICEDCQQWIKKYPNITYHHHALFYYNEIAREWLHRYKFLRDYRLRTTFSSYLYSFYLKHVTYSFVPIPLSSDRLEERGFNQVTAMLESAMVPYQSLLTKKPTPYHQSHRNRLERLEMEQPFQLTKDTSINNHKFMIIDDIYTTGRTIYHALDAFSQVNPIGLEGFTIFR